MSLILHAGDVTDNGYLGEYASVFKSYPSNIPVIPVIGNHDVRGKNYMLKENSYIHIND